MGKREYKAVEYLAENTDIKDEELANKNDYSQVKHSTFSKYIPVADQEMLKQDKYEASLCDNEDY